MTRLHRYAIAAAFCALMTLAGCGQGESPVDSPANNNGAAKPKSEVVTKAEADVSKIINDATNRFASLDYAFNEDLLEILDGMEKYFSADSEKRKSLKVTRHLPQLEEAEELDHFRETISRWESKTGKKLRTVIDQLKTALGNRDVQSKESKTEFNKKFSEAFDDIVKIEIEELRERRNRWIHDRTRLVIEELQKSDASEASRMQNVLDTPPYNLKNGKS